jgi:hypothetical protein
MVTCRVIDTFPAFRAMWPNVREKSVDEQADAGAPVRPFFCSWYEVEGRRQVGYYLGHELIRRLEGETGLRDVALLRDWQERSRAAIVDMADSRRQGPDHEDLRP